MTPGTETETERGMRIRNHLRTHRQSQGTEVPRIGAKTRDRERMTKTLKLTSGYIQININVCRRYCLEREDSSILKR
mgnify:CR=1 FL=1